MMPLLDHADAATTVDSRRRHVVLAVNRRAGTAAGQVRLAELCGRLEERGLQTTAIADLSEALALARSEHEAGRLHTLVAAGGDGTVNAALNQTAPGTPLAVYPLGTENLLARNVQMPSEPRAAADVIAARRLRVLDCGISAGRLFLLTMSAGFDAAVIHELHASRTGNIRHLAYLAPILKTARRYAFPELRVTTAEAEYRGRWCFVQNLPAYAFGLNFTPEARGDDGLIDFCLYDRGGFWSAVDLARRVYRGVHRDSPKTRCGQASRVRIDTVDPQLAQTVPVQLDGEACGMLPVELEVAPGRATIVVP